MSAALEPRAGFDWRKVRWGGPNEPASESCSYCGTAIGENEVPLILWSQDGHAAQFCAACMRTWWGVETFDEPEAA